MTRTSVLVCLSMVLGAVVGYAEERTWTDTSGRSMKAEFLRLEGTDVVFRKGGKEVTVPISRLAPQDRDAVVALSEQAGTNPFEEVADGKDSPAASPEATVKPQGTEQRMWTDAQGKQVKAKFVRINGRNVVLNRSGRILIVPYDNLSQADQDYVAELMKGRGEEDKVPPPLARDNQGNDTSGSHESSLGSGSGGPPGMLGASGPFPGGMPGAMPGSRYPGGGYPGGGYPGGGHPGGGVSGSGLPGSMNSLPPAPSGMSGMPGGPGFPGSAPPSGFPGGGTSFPGSSSSPGLGGSGYPGGMPPAGGYPGGGSSSPFPGSASSSPPGMAGGSSPSMGPGTSYPGSSSPFYPGAPGGPPGGSSPMGSGRSGMGSPFGMSGPPPTPDFPRFEFVYKCSRCNKEFSESESKRKTHCPNCGVAWINQGGTAGTFDKSAPEYQSQWNSSRTFWGARGMAKLIIAAVAFLVSLLGGGATAYSRWRKH